MKVVTVLGSPTPPGRLFNALTWLLAEVRREFLDVESELLDLRSYRISWSDGRPLHEYGDDTEQVVRMVVGADAVLIATPIFRASYTGLLKNFLDLLPVEGLIGKPVGMLAIGATQAHYLALDSQLRPVLTWFGALLLPVAVYLGPEDFERGELTSETARGEMLSLYRALIEVTRRVAAAVEKGPLPLAARRVRDEDKSGRVRTK